MDVPATALCALMKAQSPVFRNAASKIPFAAHTYALASGCTLISTGESFPSENPENAPEVTSAGWDSDDSCYQFEYRTPSGKPLVIKGLPLDDKVGIHWTTGSSGSEINSVEVGVASYTSSEANVQNGYKDLDGLLAVIGPGLKAAIQGSQGANTTSQPTRDTNPEAPPDCGAGHNEGLRAPIGHPGPVGVGMGDLHPLMPGGLDVGGGSQVGPNHPMFSGIMQPSRVPGTSGIPPGARFDPIAPEGLPGYHPDDFTHGQSRLDAWNDLGPPPGHPSHPDMDPVYGMPSMNPGGMPRNGGGRPNNRRPGQGGFGPGSFGFPGGGGGGMFG